MGTSENVSRRLMVVGVLQVLFGCLVGLTPPTAVAHFRSLVTSHIEFTANGVLEAVVGLLVPQMKLGQAGLLIMELLVHIGTWGNGLGMLFVAFTGVSSPLLPIINGTHPPKVISDRGASHVLLLTCGVTIISGLVIAALGLIRGAGMTKRKAP